jgi:mRNA-degrading endonuclease toxin of MazEF toxin-antitoxin module
VTPPKTVKPAEIYYVTIDPAHAVGHEQHSRRPFVIVSRFRVNMMNWVVVGVPLTTTGADKPLTSHPPHRIYIPANEISRDIGFNGAIEDCVALTDQIRALAPERLENRMGTMSGTAFASVGLGLLYLFDLR